MTIEKLTKKASAKMDASASVWYKKVTLTDLESSSAYLLPNDEIYAIAIDNTGTAIIYTTNSSEEDILNDLASWYAWDGVSDINFGITAIYIANFNNTSTITITVKTRER